EFTVNEPDPPEEGKEADPLDSANEQPGPAVWRTEKNAFAATIVPLRVPPLTFDATVYPTVPLPVPDAPDVTVRKSGLLLTAVHGQVLALAVTAKVPDVPVEST